MKKLFHSLLVLAIALNVFTLTAEAQDNLIYGQLCAGTTPTQTQTLFSKYGYTPTAKDLSWWCENKKNSSGILEQNLQNRFGKNKFGELSLLGSQITPDIIGAAAPFRPTEFKTSLGQSFAEGHSGTTLKVTSITTKDGNTLSPTTLGTSIVLSINPSAGNSEVVLCTGLTTATKTFTGCTFGQRFDQSGSQAANIKAHAPGELVIISNTDTYLTREVPFLNASSTITGLWTFATSTTGMFPSGDGVYFRLGNGTEAPLSKCFYIHNGSATPPKLCYNDTSNKWLIYNDGVNSFDISAGGSGLTAEAPIYLDGSQINLATSTYWFGMETSVTPGTLKVASSTVANGTASGKGIDDLFNARWNATSTHPGLMTSTSTVNGNFHVNGNSTTTGSFDIGGDLCFAGGSCVQGITTLVSATSSDFTIVNSGTETTPYSFTVPGGTLGTNHALKVTIFYREFAFTSNSDNTFAIRAKYGGSTLVTLTLTNTTPVTVNQLDGQITFYIYADGATNAQRGSLTMVGGRNGLVTTGAAAGVGDSLNFSSAINSATNQTLAISFDFGGTTTDATFSPNFAMVEVVR